MFEVINFLNLFLCAQQAPAGKEPCIFPAHPFRNIVCLCGSYLHPRCGDANAVCSDWMFAEDKHQNLLWICSLPRLPANNKNKKQDGRGEPETKQQERRVLHRVAVCYTSQIIVLIEKSPCNLRITDTRMKESLRSKRVRIQVNQHKRPS